jgi:hypothetical protein
MSIKFTWSLPAEGARQSIRRAWASAALAGLVSLAGATASRAALAPFVTLSPISDGSPATDDRGYAAAETNATAFKNQSLVTVGDYQFTSYYAADQSLILGRRNLATSPDTWRLVDTGLFSTGISDSHTVSTIGIDGDGFLHVAWGVHDDPLRYTRSTTPVLNDDPFTVPGNMAGQLPLQTANITYPEFWNIPDSGDLLLTYRTGGSGNGEYQLAKWDDEAGAWLNVHAVLNSGNSNTGPQPWIDNDFNSAQAPPDANAYHNGLVYDSTGRLHTTWTWRTGSPNPGGPTDFQSNHNVMYAYSDNDGVDWRLADGTLLARNGVHDIDENNATPVIDLPFGSSLINQSSSAIGPDDALYVATWYAPEADANNHTRQYMLLEYDGAAWQEHQIGARDVENNNNPVPESQLAAFRMSRPIVAVDDDNRVFVVFSDHQRGQGVTVAYSQSESRDDWRYIDLATDDDMRLWEPKFDLGRWEQDGVLSLLYQPSGQGLSPNAVSILEWDARVYFTPSGDFDGDGNADGADLLAWQRGLGSTDAARAAGDADLDGDVDAEDLSIWKSTFTGASPTPAATIPEPAPAVSLLAGLAIMAAASRLRRANVSCYSTRRRAIRSLSSPDCGRKQTGFPKSDNERLRFSAVGIAAC